MTKDRGSKGPRVQEGQPCPEEEDKRSGGVGTGPRPQASSRQARGKEFGSGL